VPAHDVVIGGSKLHELVLAQSLDLSWAFGLGSEGGRKDVASALGELLGGTEVDALQVLRRLRQLPGVRQRLVVNLVRQRAADHDSRATSDRDAVAALIIVRRRRHDSGVALDF
jgi:hypothetical protein